MDIKYMSYDDMWIALRNKMWTERSRIMVDILFRKYTEMKIKLENPTKHNSSSKKDCQMVTMPKFVFDMIIEKHPEVKEYYKCSPS